jgi:Family of unknown function (DUF5695)
LNVSFNLVKTNPVATVAIWFVASLLPLLAQSADSQLSGSQLSGSSSSQFDVKFNAGAIVNLRRRDDTVDTDYLQGRRLGDVNIQCRRPGEEWQSIQTARLSNSAACVLSPDGKVYQATYDVTNDTPAALRFKTQFSVQDKALIWTMTLQNLADQPLEIGDLALPLSIGARAGRGRGGGAGGVTNNGTGGVTTNNTANDGTQRANPNAAVVLKHSFISGHGSFFFWMREARSAIVGPYLTLVPLESTSLEYWEAGLGTYRVFIHSAVSGAAAKEHGTNWRQPHTSTTLASKGKSGDTRTYQFKFRWADDYESVRQILVDEGKVDVQVVPGMTLPNDLFAKFALRTKQKITAVEAEFPKQTTIKSLGAKGGAQLYQVNFSRLGENRLTVRYGKDQHLYLEFFSTEPLETLIRKRAAFIARSQHRDPEKWYNGLITDWAMDRELLLSPDNYDRIRGFRIYAVTCDDAGLGHPSYLAAKNAEFPTQSEVEALDYYIAHFFWGGLQRSTNETYAYGVYGIPDWKKNRESTDPGRNGQTHLWRVYDYPHVILMYYSLHQVAQHYPNIKTELSADEYLRRAAGTAIAMFTVPMQIERWSAYNTGFYNELIIPDLINALQARGWNDEADTLRNHWERKVRNFVNNRVNLFQSEYAFDSTGFESTAAIARYALSHADAPGRTNLGVLPENARRFMERQLAANVFCRGWLEPAYYYLGSDYRGGGGNGYTLSYMAQMGGWGVLDYALNFATNARPYLRLGYASYLSSWALVNSGTPESNYGYWYPGKANDGAAGGGFEPAPFGNTWLQQPHHRGSWYYACEIDLGYSGALRSAATVLADDPLFGRFCYGGDWRKTSAGLEVIPKDGVRRRFYTRLDNGNVSLALDRDHFAAAQPIVLKPDLTEIRFELETDNSAAHPATLRLSGLSSGEYSVRDRNGAFATFVSTNGQETALLLPMSAGTRTKSFTITKSSGTVRRGLALNR